MFKILVIEDTLRLQRHLKKSLQIQGFEVVEAEDGESGLRQAQGIHPTLIISNLHLPGISGIEVCRQIKANPAIASTFFILLTADDSPENKNWRSRQVQMPFFQSRSRLKIWGRAYTLGSGCVG